MADAKHTPTGDRSFSESFYRLAVSGVALFAAAVVGFGLVGQIGRDDDPDDVRITDNPTVAGSEQDSSDPTAAPSTSAPSSSEPEPTATSSAPETTEPAASRTTEDGDRTDPASISVQILDGVFNDGRAAANELSADLRAAGYRVVADSASVREPYEKTTVFFSKGFKKQAEQIAAEFGIDLVEPNPNLTESVNVHVVVGRDRA